MPTPPPITATELNDEPETILVEVSEVIGTSFSIDLSIWTVAVASFFFTEFFAVSGRLQYPIWLAE